MTHPTPISSYVSRLAVSLLLLVAVQPAAYGQQPKNLPEPKDSIAFFRGFAVTFDLVGPACLLLSDRGTYEGSLRINLHDQWFPTVELGIGRANYKDDGGTDITYKTTAPFFRVGMDWNVMKKKHEVNRIYAGFRYAFTSYSCDIIREALPDPVFLGTSEYGATDVSCNMHWLEAVFGIDAQVFGPFHLGWNVRYKRRLAHHEGDIGTSWYVPGFGANDSDCLTANFNIIIDI